MSMKIKSFFHVLAVLLLYAIASSFSEAAFQLCSRQPWDEILYVGLNSSSLLFLLGLYSQYILRKSYQEIGLGKPLPDIRWCVLAILSSLLISAFYLCFTEGTIYWTSMPWQECMDACITAVLSTGVLRGLEECLLFGGVLPAILCRAWGRRGGILLVGVLYVATHWESVEVGDVCGVLQMAIALLLAGLALVLVAYQTGSIWSSTVISISHSILAGNSQIFRIGTAEASPSMITYLLPGNRLLTGIPDAQGVDAGVPVMLGYVLIMIVALVGIYRQRGRAR